MKIANLALLIVVSSGLACTANVTPQTASLEQNEVGTRFYREGLRGVDLSKLSHDRRELVLEVLNGGECDCGCSMNLAECLVTDDNCDRGPSLARIVVDAAQQGRDDSTIQQQGPGLRARRGRRPA